MAVLKSPRNNKNKVKWAQSYASSRPKAAPSPQLVQSPRSNARWHGSFNSNYGNSPHPLTNDQPLTLTSALNFKLRNCISFHNSTNTSRTPFIEYFNVNKNRIRALNPFTFTKVL